MALKYTKEEQNLMKKAYDNALDVLDELWNLSEYQQIRVDAKLRGISDVDDYYPSWDWSLVLNDKEIYLESTFHRSSTQIILEQKTRFTKKRKYDYGVIDIFLKEFEQLKPKVEERIKAGKLEKSKSLNEYEMIAEKYSKESRVEITLPDTMNQHSIEISKEDGRTVGKINFGSGLIKIITRGSIEVERNDDIPYIKRK